VKGVRTLKAKVLCCVFVPSHVSYLRLSDCHSTTVVLNIPGFVSANKMSKIRCGLRQFVA